MQCYVMLCNAILLYVMLFDLMLFCVIRCYVVYDMFCFVALCCDTYDMTCHVMSGDDMLCYVTLC